jgi:hypothetical protein
MGKHPMRLVMLVPLASAILTQPSHAITGQVRVVFAKAGLIAGAGGVQLKNAKGVIIKLQGKRVGVELFSQSVRDRVRP